jgi:apolipoprotein N-acyltransferase
MRAVENGRFVARAASSGVSQIIDPNGRIVSNIDIDKSDTIVGNIEALDKKTFYTLYGYLFPHLMIFMTLVLFVIALKKK